MKDYLISHIKDVDGITPVILMKLVGAPFDYKLLDIYEVELFMEEFLKNPLEEYEHIYITDLTVPESIYKKIDEHPAKDKFKVFDHHKTHEYAKDKDYVTLDMTECGTTLFYNYLKTKYPMETPALNQYIKSVKNLDLWIFEQNQDTLAPTLGLLFDLYGEERYINEMIERLRVVTEEFVLTVFEKDLLQLEEEIKNRYIDKRDLRMKKVVFQGYPAGIVFAERYRNEISTELLRRHPELEFIVVINMNGGISFRSRSIDVSEIAKSFDGGGHPLAAGAGINAEKQEQILKDLFKGEITFGN